jgi:hypothetical protein
VRLDPLLNPGIYGRHVGGHGGLDRIGDEATKGYQTLGLVDVVVPVLPMVVMVAPW